MWNSACLQMSWVPLFEFIWLFINYYNFLGGFSYIHNKRNSSLFIGRHWRLRCWQMIYEKWHLGTEATSSQSPIPAWAMLGTAKCEWGGHRSIIPVALKGGPSSHHPLPGPVPRLTLTFSHHSVTLGDRHGAPLWFWPQWFIFILLNQNMDNKDVFLQAVNGRPKKPVAFNQKEPECSSVGEWDSHREGGMGFAA